MAVKPVHVKSPVDIVYQQNVYKTVHNIIWLYYIYGFYVDIIHCVGPVGEKPDLLASCYKSALDTLVQNKLKSVAFPCISTGVYGYPNENAAHVVLKTVRSWLENSSNYDSIDRIIFCLFLQTDIDIYNRLIPKYFSNKWRKKKEIKVAVFFNTDLWNW